MKSKILFLVTILCINNLYAERICFYGSADFCEGEKYYVYADIANVRVVPVATSEISCKLSAGQEIIVVAVYDKENDAEIDGVRGQWLYINTTDGTNREGWLWSNTLSPKQLRRGNTKIVFGIDKVTEEVCKYTFKAVDNGKIVDRKSVNINIISDGYMFNEAKIFDNISLENVKCVAYFSIGGNACGSGHNGLYFAWLDETKKLVELPKVWSMGDACAVSYGEALYIPNETNGGIYNLLVKVTESGIPPDDDLDCDYTKWGWEYKTELFKWNGEKAVQIKN